MPLTTPLLVEKLIVGNQQHEMLSVLGGFRSSRSVENIVAVAKDVARDPVVSARRRAIGHHISSLYTEL